MKEGYKIYDFKVGQTITRVQRGYTIVYNKSEFSGVPEPVKVPKYTDYMGDPLKYNGIYNNQIHFEIIGKDKTDTLSLEEFEDGWDLYEEPPQMEGKSKRNKKDVSRDSPIEVAEGVFVGGDPPPFLQKLISSMVRQQESEQLKNKFIEFMDSKTMELQKEADDSVKKIEEDHKKVMKMEKTLNWIFYSFFMVTWIYNVMGSFTETKQSIMNTLLLVLIATIYSEVKLFKAKKLRERAERAIEKFKTSFKRKSK